MRIIIFALLIGFYIGYKQAEPVGATTLGAPMEVVPTCAKGEVLYPMVRVHTNWRTQGQKIEYSWQCFISNKNYNERQEPIELIDWGYEKNKEWLNR